MVSQHTKPVKHAARGYVEHKWAVLPLWWPAPSSGCGCRQAECDNAGKHPIPHLVPHGLHDASTSLGDVEAWWKAFPRANVGIRTGAESGLVVVDIDGKAGAETLRALIDRHGRFEALWVRTGSGGWHAYLAHPGVAVPNSNRRLGAGLDLRGDGGYVVAPPSRHVSGETYQWLRARRDPPPMPDWLVELTRPPARSQAQEGAQVDRMRLSTYAEAALCGEAEDVAAAPLGQRNSRLNLAAFRLGQLVGASLLTEDAVSDALRSAATSAGLAPREASATIRSGLLAGRSNPRRVEVTQSAPEQQHHRSGAKEPDRDERLDRQAETC